VTMMLARPLLTPFLSHTYTCATYQLMPLCNGFWCKSSSRGHLEQCVISGAIALKLDGLACDALC
jgi:hypothetical protein